ncbi:hypothetical protein TNCV_222961 [Trichonephila clavipes]|nr:hypothetical protein TNCV_222961 [Trichonephila clavipes]
METEDLDQQGKVIDLRLSPIDLRSKSIILRILISARVVFNPSAGDDCFSLPSCFSAPFVIQLERTFSLEAELEIVLPPSNKPHWSREWTRGQRVTSSNLVPLKTRRAEDVDAR